MAEQNCQDMCLPSAPLVRGRAHRDFKFKLENFPLRASSTTRPTCARIDVLCCAKRQMFWPHPSNWQHLCPTRSMPAGFQLTGCIHHVRFYSYRRFSHLQIALLARNCHPTQRRSAPNPTLESYQPDIPADTLATRTQPGIAFDPASFAWCGPARGTISC
jgi:hypothetical protein